MEHVKKYSLFNEQRYAFVRVKWQITVQPCNNTNWKDKLERRLLARSESEPLPQIASK